MSDLVERLRDADRYKRDTTVDDPPGIMAEAADELERLEQFREHVLAALKEDAYPCDERTCCQAMCRLAKELGIPAD